MRSLATINRRSPSGRPRSYISRTFPLAIRGRSASAVIVARLYRRARPQRVAGLDGRTSVECECARSWARGDSRDLLQPPHDLLCVAHIVPVVEDLIEVQPSGALVAREQLAQRNALVPRALRELLHDAVGVVARGAGGDEREQHALGEERAVRELEVRAHAPRVDRHVAYERDRALL